MSIQELLAGGGGALLLLMTIVEIAPIKINPWSRIAKAIGRAMGLEAIEKKLDSHIKADDERNADWHRARILQFNTELLRNIMHTEEDFNEIMYNIDCYEHYCAEHPEYKNSRAVHAIANIGRVYDERQEKRDFL